MSQVSNHIGQTYTDGRIDVVPPNYIQEENVPPLEPSANSTKTSQTSEMSAISKTLAIKISIIKSTTNTMQQQSHQQQQPFNHSTLHSKCTHPTILIQNTGLVVEVEAVDKGVVVVEEVVADKEV